MGNLFQKLLLVLINDVEIVFIVKYEIEANAYVATRLLHMYVSCLDME